MSDTPIEDAVSGCCLLPVPCAVALAGKEDEGFMAALMKKSEAEAKAWLCLARRCRPLGLRGVSSTTNRAYSNMPWYDEAALLQTTTMQMVHEP